MARSANKPAYDAAYNSPQAQHVFTPRIQELITQARARREQSITGHGHSLAMTAASAGMSPSAKLSHQLELLHLF